MTETMGRALLVIADDIGIGPETTRGILELARQGVLTGTVLLVNSPYAEQAVRDWKALDRPIDLGWHPNLTLDRPCAGAERVPSLVQPNGDFWPLAAFMRRALLRQLRPQDIETELRAQYRRYVEMVGAAPVLVNAHQHVALFQPVGRILIDILKHASPAPYVRCVREPWSMLWRVRGARWKRAVLNRLGRRQSQGQLDAGFPGNDWLMGTTDPRWVRDPEFFSRWLRAVPGRIVELACHPGFEDATLLGRDCREGDGLMQRRVDEYRLLCRPEFLSAVRDAGFTLMFPRQMAARSKSAASNAPCRSRAGAAAACEAVVP
jgi:predicted glycoside hydrolase/deacetylase ChbG (UPF0249 family)